jgi:hypothetical protein
MIDLILAAILTFTGGPAPERCGWVATPCVMTCRDMCDHSGECIEACVRQTCPTSDAIPVYCEEE